MFKPENLDLLPDNLTNIEEDKNNWIITSGRLNMGRTPYADSLAQEILHHDQPMPQSVREFLADFVIQRLKPDIPDLPYDQLSRSEQVRCRRHDVNLHYFGYKRDLNPPRTWEEIKSELAKQHDVDDKTIDSDIRGRKNKPKY